MGASGKCLKSIVGVKKPEKDDQEKVSGNKNNKEVETMEKLIERFEYVVEKVFKKGSHHRAALETSECSSTADAFNAAVATIVRAPPKNFRVVRQEWAAIRIQIAFRWFLIDGWLDYDGMCVVEDNGGMRNVLWCGTLKALYDPGKKGIESLGRSHLAARLLFMAAK
ncbi:hypothetical protein IFM89_035929 [Coptis chinensis]|uniref:Uncharacterized protein n=1 Tax=Coptis chinensis TaxID=261450 RepID=A0A835GZT1_9MAGN|nr:hypothetical protein IFM89_035929 [Coptis chinensis]